MNKTQEYIDEQMKDPFFLKAYNEEKAKLELELLVDELTNNIKMEKPYNELLKGVKKIKRTLVKV